MEILITADGSSTVRHPLLEQLYHSDRGAIGEAQHVYIAAGLEYIVGVRPEANAEPITILEIGFGTGLNCWLTLQKASELSLKVIYHTIELYPIDIDTAQKLNYTCDPRFVELHCAPWDIQVNMGDNFSLIKHQAKIESFDYSQCGAVDLVYYDAFAPDCQQELWSDEIFESIFRVMKSGGVLTTYTAKGLVKQNLRSAGFTVLRLVGALGKRHMLRAEK